ncbi:MAG: hypothetical protein ACM3PS_01920 [Syntrophothermus sp.]
MEENLSQARQHLKELEELGITMNQAIDLGEEEVKAFSDAFTVVIRTVEGLRTAVVS